VQLLVPAVAAAGGLIWLGEPLTAALAGATLLILAGIGLTLRR
jgi:drug/metabolite transporter (DMT)-like permease